MSPELCVTICLPLYLLPTSLECLRVLLRARKAAKVMEDSHDRTAQSIAVRFLALFIVFCSALAVLSMALIPILIVWLRCFGLPLQHAIYTTVLVDICSEVRARRPHTTSPHSYHRSLPFFIWSEIHGLTVLFCPFSQLPSLRY